MTMSLQIKSKLQKRLTLDQNFKKVNTKTLIKSLFMEMECQFI